MKRLALVLPLVVLFPLIILAAVLFFRANMDNRQTGIPAPKLNQFINKKGVFVTIKQINGYYEPEENFFSGYITVEKWFKILEEKEDWLLIKMVMPDGGDYGWEGWIKKNPEAYEER